MSSPAELSKPSCCSLKSSKTTWLLSCAEAGMLSPASSNPKYKKRLNINIDLLSPKELTRANVVQCMQMH